MNLVTAFRLMVWEQGRQRQPTGPNGSAGTTCESPTVSFVHVEDAISLNQTPALH